MYASDDIVAAEGFTSTMEKVMCLSKGRVACDWRPKT
jgi:hypothetical protein